MHLLLVKKTANQNLFIRFSISLKKDFEGEIASKIQWKNEYFFLYCWIFFTRDKCNLFNSLFFYKISGAKASIAPVLNKTLRLK